MNCFLSAVAVLAFASFTPAQQTPPPTSVNDKLDLILSKLTACEAKFAVIDKRLDALEAKGPRAAAQSAVGYFPQAGDCGSFGVRYAAAGDCGQAFASYGAGACGAAASAGAGDCGAAGRTGPIRRMLGRFFGN